MSIPPDFTVSLYEPDQQVVITKRKLGGLGSSSTYDFDLPQTSFRAPSASNLDRIQTGPADIATTPKLQFQWRKESRFSRELYQCYMTGKSTDAVSRKRWKDPDIPIATLKNFRELTVNQPNAEQLGLEDQKGLEVVLLLAAVTIKDVHANTNIRLAFNVNDSSGRKTSNYMGSNRGISDVVTNSTRSPSLSRDIVVPSSSSLYSVTPPTERKPEWLEHIDDEDTQRRLQKDQEDEAERKRLIAMVEEEELEAKRKKLAVDEETARLRAQYGQETSSSNDWTGTRPAQHLVSSYYAPSEPMISPPLGGYYGNNTANFYAPSLPSNLPLPPPPPPGAAYSNPYLQSQHQRRSKSHNGRLPPHLLTAHSAPSVGPYMSGALPVSSNNRIGRPGNQDDNRIGRPSSQEGPGYRRREDASFTNGRLNLGNLEEGIRKLTKKKSFFT